MTRERYARWMAIWKWFLNQPSTPALADLFDMLHEMWRQDRMECTPEQLATYSQPLDLDSDPYFRKFLDDLNKGFSKETK